jgi:hypothetical protein
MLLRDPENPPDRDRMRGTEFKALETGNAYIFAHRAGNAVDDIKHPHRAFVDAAPAFNAEHMVHPYVDEKVWGAGEHG